MNEKSKKVSHDIVNHIQAYQMSMELGHADHALICGLRIRELASELVGHARTMVESNYKKLMAGKEKHGAA